MPYKLDVTPKHRYLHIRITGDNTPETVRGYLAEIPAVCERHRCPNILVEEHLTGPGLGAFDIFGVVTEGSRKIGDVGRIAFVDTNPDHDSRLMQFAETVANNRGVSVRVFADVAQAEQWLAQ